MRIALVIGVAEYDTESHLPACRADAEAIHQLLNATGLYNSILVLSERLTAEDLKRKSIEFIESLAPLHGNGT